jgi:16S rRNA (guanine527-N7)-methyltransferase
VRELLESVTGRAVSRETIARLEQYAELLTTENERQNLVGPSTIEQLWDRHIVDSAQIVRFQPHAGASWVDIGSGAGLPGVVLACLVEGPVTLVEPRKLRAQFLTTVVEALGLCAEIVQRKADHITGRFDVITARAVAPLPRLLELSAHLSTTKTVWVLPKGRSASSELADAQRAWQGAFHVEQSITDSESYIIVGTGVRAR